MRSPAGAAAAAADSGTPAGPVPFRGERQAGIITEAQDRMHFGAFDVTTDSRRRGRDAAGVDGDGRADDAGRRGVPERRRRAQPVCAADRIPVRRSVFPPPQLTLTIGFGPSFFVKDGKDRFGIAAQRPAGLADLPKFPNETMDPARCGGDICVQACANDPQVAVHAVRNLARVGFGTVAVRYSQLGFGRTSSTTRGTALRETCSASRTERTTSRPRTPSAGQERLGGRRGRPDWLTGGTYLVTRRIRMRIENWDRTTLLEQERVIGRQKGSGAPNG